MPVEKEPFKGARSRFCFDRANRRLITVPSRVSRNGVQGVEGDPNGTCGIRSHLEAYLVDPERLNQERLPAPPLTPPPVCLSVVLVAMSASSRFLK